MNSELKNRMNRVSYCANKLRRRITRNNTETNMMAMYPDMFPPSYQKVMFDANEKSIDTWQGRLLDAIRDLETEHYREDSILDDGRLTQFVDRDIDWFSDD